MTGKRAGKPVYGGTGNANTFLFPFAKVTTYVDERMAADGVKRQALNEFAAAQSAGTVVRAEPSISRNRNSCRMPNQQEQEFMPTPPPTGEERLRISRPSTEERRGAKMEPQPEQCVWVYEGSEGWMEWAQYKGDRRRLSNEEIVRRQSIQMFPTFHPDHYGDHGRRGQWLPSAFPPGSERGLSERVPPAQGRAILSNVTRGDFNGD